MILGASILQLPAIEKAKQMGLQVIAVDRDPQAIGFHVEGVLKEIISTIDTPGVLRAAKKHQINGIITLASDIPMQTVAAVCSEMGLTGVSEETALKATNKGVMREALAKGNVPIPMYFRVQDKAAFIRAVQEIRNAGYRCIVKPADNSGSRGVDLLAENSDLDRAYEYTHGFSRNGEIVVEEFMQGPEVSVETLAVNGKVEVIQITDKTTTGAPFFVEMGHVQPSLLDMAVKEQIRKVAIAANKALGITSGPSHTEIIVTKDGPKIVELGARLGGDCITTHLVPLSTGVDMVESAIKIALGEDVDVTAKWNKGSAIRYFRTGQGTVKEIRGLETARTMPGIIQVSVVHGVGELLGEIKSSNDRAGFVIAQDENNVKAMQDAEDAQNQIEFILE